MSTDLRTPRITAKGTALSARIDTLGWTRVRGHGRTPPNAGRFYLGAEEEHPYIFTQGEWTLTLEDTAAGAIHNAQLVRTPTGHTPAQRFIFKTRRATSEAVLAAVAPSASLNELIDLTTRNPGLMAWLAAEITGINNAAAARRRARRDRLQELRRRPVPVHGGDTGAAQYTAAMTRIHDITTITREGAGTIDTVAQVATITEALETMKTLLDPEANTARQTEVADIEKHGGTR